ncbi:hypothetical protein HZQ89_08645 [Elizabethkingia anophelis]|nr:hypothetical protein [Elizabethkingia anophelis]MCT4316711.1 hypothetical protein [Elizabethkingia anophelis]
MLPPITKHTPKKLNIPKEIYASLKPEERKGYWFISWLGRAYYKGNKIYREYYISLCNNTFYRFKDVKTFCLEFPEEYSMRYKQGNYYFYNGKFYTSAYNSNKTLIIQNISLKKSINTFVLDLHKLLGNGKTFYPLFSPNKTDPTCVDPYKDTPCYLIEVNAQKFLIPLNVIQSYYYAFSSLSIYYLIYDLLRDGLAQSHTNKDNKVIVPYKSSIINESEAQFFSKFYFLNEGKFDSLYKVHQAFQMSLINNQRNKKPLKSYIIYEIPYSNHTELTLDLYYQPIDSDKEINMVYAIKNVRPCNQNLLFHTTKFLLHDIDSSIMDDDLNNEPTSENAKISNIKNKDSIISHGAYDSNFNIIENISLEGDSPIFSESPEINLIPPNEIQERQSYAHLFVNEVKKISPEISDQRNNTGDTGIANLNLDAKYFTPYLAIILDTFKLISENNLFKCQYLFLQRYKDSLFSYDPYSSENGTILLFQVSYRESHYCIVVRQNLLQRIGIIRRSYSENFFPQNDTKLARGLIYIFKMYNYNWAKLKTTQDNNTLSYGFQVVNAINKTKDGTNEQRIKSLYDRITTFIINQVDHEANNQ